MKGYKIAIIAPAPLYYHIPMYRELEKSKDIDLTVYYCSDETIRGGDVKKMYNSSGNIADSKDLLKGYYSVLLRNYSLSPSIFKWPFGLINFGIWNEIKNGKYDAVVLQAWVNVTWLLAFFACLAYRTKVLFMTDANIAAESHKNPFIKFIKKIFLEKFLFRHAAGFLISGTANAQLYKHYGVSEDKLWLFHFSFGYKNLIVEANKILKRREIIRNSFHINKNDFIVLYVGRFAKEKSIETLVNAYDTLQIKNKKLFLVGDGMLKKQIEENVAKNNIKGVNFLGFLPRKEILKFYAMADVFVLPSSQETWGMVVNEAMCFGLPVIVSDQVGSAIDLVKNGDNGFIFHSGDSVELQKKIQLVHSMSQRDRELLGERSQKMISDWAGSVSPRKQILNIINSFL